MTDEPSNPQFEGPATLEWPASNYVILFAVAFLSGAGVASAVSAETTANRLAKFAYYFLVIGVGLRIAEQTFEERHLAILSNGNAMVLRSIQSWIGDGWLSSVKTGRFLARLEREFDHVLSTARIRLVHDEEIRRGLALTVPLTFVGGVVVVVWWWLDPRVAVSDRFLVGWLLALVIMFGLSYFVSQHVRDPGE